MLKRTVSTKEIDEKEAMIRAEALCSSRECCISEIEEKLIRWGQNPEAQQRIICHLLEERYIDEKRFCRAFALDKMRYNRWGRIKIGQALRLLGVSERDREAALDELPAEEYEEIFVRLLRAKSPTIKAASDYEHRAKLIRFLQGRGFELRLIMNHIENLPQSR